MWRWKWKSGDRSRIYVENGFVISLTFDLSVGDCIVIPFTLYRFPLCMFRQSNGHGVEIVTNLPSLKVNKLF